MKMGSEMGAAASAPGVGAEMKKMAAEPLLPIEKKLIAWSLGIGIVLLVVLVAATRMFLHTSG